MNLDTVTVSLLSTAKSITGINSLNFFISDFLNDRDSIKYFRINHSNYLLLINYNYKDYIEYAKLIQFNSDPYRIIGNIIKLHIYKFYSNSPISIDNTNYNVSIDYLSISKLLKTTLTIKIINLQFNSIDSIGINLLSEGLKLIILLMKFI